jgi:hypothetical protein
MSRSDLLVIGEASVIVNRGRKRYKFDRMPGISTIRPLARISIHKHTTRILSWISARFQGGQECVLIVE